MPHLSDGPSIPLHETRRRGFSASTLANYRFGSYRIVNQQAGTVDTLDGKRLPGVPMGFVRLALRAGPVVGVALDLDHTMASSIFADEKNTIFVTGWASE